MSTDAKKGYGSTIVLLALSVLALYGGLPLLLVLVPAAMLVWYMAGSAKDGRRHN